MWPVSLLDCRLCPSHRGVWSSSGRLLLSGLIRQTPKVTRSIAFPLWAVRCASVPRLRPRHQPRRSNAGLRGVKWCWRSAVSTCERGHRNRSTERIRDHRGSNPSSERHHGGRRIQHLVLVPDSQTLSFDQLDPSNDVTSSWLLSDPNAMNSLASAVEIPLHPKGLAWSGFLGSSTKGVPRGIGVQTAVQDEPPLASSQKVVSIDSQTGAVVRPFLSCLQRSAQLRLHRPLKTRFGLLECSGRRPR